MMQEKAPRRKGRISPIMHPHTAEKRRQREGGKGGRGEDKKVKKTHKVKFIIKGKKKNPIHTILGGRALSREQGGSSRKRKPRGPVRRDVGGSRNGRAGTRGEDSTGRRLHREGRCQGEGKHREKTKFGTT